MAELRLAPWPTLTRGRLSPEADFYEYLNGQTLGGASVDFDRVMHAAHRGTWWPAGHPLDEGEGMATAEEASG